MALQVWRKKGGGTLKDRPGSWRSGRLPILGSTGRGTALEQRATGSEFRLPSHHREATKFRGSTSDPGVQKGVLLQGVAAAKLLVGALTVGTAPVGSGSLADAFPQIGGLGLIDRGGRGISRTHRQGYRHRHEARD
jgi:hypothetical protein